MMRPALEKVYLSLADCYGNRLYRQSRRIRSEWTMRSRETRC